MPENDDWYAAVRYGDNHKEILKVKYVKNFKPSKLNDFDPNKIHRIKTNAWSQDKSDFVYYKGIIEGLGVSKSGAESARRAFRANQTQAEKDATSHILSSLPTLPQQSSSDTGGREIGDVLDSMETKMDEKRDAVANANKELEAQISSRLRMRQESNVCDKQLSPEAGKGRGSAKRKSKSSEDTLVDSEKKKKKNQETNKETADQDWADLLAVSLIEKRKAKSSTPDNTVKEPIKKCCENAVQRSLQRVRRPNLSISPVQTLDILGDITASHDNVGVQVQELKHELQLFRGDNAAKLENIESQLSSIMQNNFNGPQIGESSGLHKKAKVLYERVVCNSKVDLGSGFMCWETSWRTMNTCEKISDWCVAIVRGTFGDKRAMLYRIIPRYTDVDYFPVNFIATAKIHYEEFIDRRIAELSALLLDDPDNVKIRELHDFFSLNKKLLIKQLGASISDRTSNMYKQWRAQEELNNPNLPPRVKRPKHTKMPKAPTQLSSSGSPVNSLSATNSRKNKCKLLTMPKMSAPAKKQPERAVASQSTTSMQQSHSTSPLLQFHSTSPLQQKSMPCSSLSINNSPRSGPSKSTPPRGRTRNLSSSSSESRSPSPISIRSSSKCSRASSDEIDENSGESGDLSPRPILLRDGLENFLNIGNTIPPFTDDRISGPLPLPDSRNSNEPPQHEKILKLTDL